MKTSKEKSDYPIVLKAKHIQEILGCSEPVAYKVMKSEGFPLISVGRLKRVNRDDFFNWLDTQKGAM